MLQDSNEQRLTAQKRIVCQIRPHEAYQTYGKGVAYQLLGISIWIVFS